MWSTYVARFMWLTSIAIVAICAVFVLNATGSLNRLDALFGSEFLLVVRSNFEPAIGPLAVAMISTVLLVPPARWLSFRLGAVSSPGGRNIHSRPTGRLGGLGLAAGFLVSGAIFAVNSGLQRDHVVALLVIGAAGVAVLGIDDIRGLKARWTLLIQLTLGIAVASVIPIRVINFGGGHLLQLALVLAIPLTVAWLVGMQNTMNLLDGVDGLAAGVAAIVAFALLLAAVNREQQDPSQIGVVQLCAALIGACIGFLFFNFHPARIFMGGGSHFLGLTLGTISIFGVAKGALIFALIVPVMALAVPIVDTVWTIVRRRRDRLSIAHADTAHIHHQLLDFGLGQRSTCLVFYLATGITSGLGLMVYGHKRIIAAVMVLLFVALFVVLARGVATKHGAISEATVDII